MQSFEWRAVRAVEEPLSEQRRPEQHVGVLAVS